MAIDKAVDSTQLNADLTTIADAIREKAGVSDNFTFPAGFAAAIAAIESGGNLITGTVTATDTPACIIIEGKLPNIEQAPLALFFYETGSVNTSDTTHTRDRHLLYFSIRKDLGTSTDVIGSYVGAGIRMNAGSSSLTAIKSNYTNAFKTVSESSSTGDYPYNVVCGYLSTNEIYIKTGCLISGRTYVWGVIPWVGG